MATGKGQPKWDIYESAILLDGYLESLTGKTTRAEIIRRVSVNLRQMAENRDIKIDNAYRNESGISYQMQSMDSAYQGRKVCVPASKLFTETVSIYNNSREKYEIILKKAKNMVSQKTPHNNLYPQTDNGIANVLKSHYQYGFKYESIRELMRFRHFAALMNVEIPEDDEQLKSVILSTGTLIEDKVYFKRVDLPQELQELVNNAFATGAEVVYYTKLLELNAEWMTAHTITSEEILKEYLKKYIPDVSFSKKFMVCTKKRSEKLAVTDELRRVWGKEQTESVQALSNKLPYIPLNNIWRTISGNEFFVLVSEGEYLLLDRFLITEEEANRILEYVEMSCRENGFASLNNVPMGDIEVENDELPLLALWNAIYKKVLYSQYFLNGRILTRNQPNLDAVSLLNQYISGRDECTFNEIADKVTELTGGINRDYVFTALYDSMIRVDKNRFVADHFVRFNMEEIDGILASFIGNHFCALRDITTFAMFPICGQPWNHYLLESYCYRYSRKYSLHVIHFNDKNAGIIAEKEFDKDYDEMLSLALARTNIALDSETIGKYLFESGYTSKRKYTKLAKIAQRVEELRKER